jgi:hypothetical protein
LQLLVADLCTRLSQLGAVDVADLPQYAAWLQADEFERLAEVVDHVTSFHNAHGILAPRVYVRVDDIENTSDTGLVSMELVPNPENDSPYYALVYDAPASDPRSSFMLASDDLRELAAQLRAVDEDQRTGSVMVTLDSVDDGTWESDRHPQFEVQKKPDITDQAAARLWFDDLKRAV